VEPYWT